jgi:lysophospholipase L1-like esterase
MPSLSEPTSSATRPPRKPVPWLCFMATALALLLLVAAALPAALQDAPPLPPETQAPSPTTSILPTSTPSPVPLATPTPTPEPMPPYDFSRPVPEREAVGVDYFADAVFIGDSRTDGLKLFGGITEADFIEHTGITVFEVGTKKVIRKDGEKYTVLEALALKQYKKIYIMLGVNELGYYDEPGFAREYAGFVDEVRKLQPAAILYLQNLVAINPEKAKANSQPYYVTNEQIAVYNGIIADIAAEKQTVLVDVNAALVDENGILPREGTTDGVHFSKDYCVKWYDYLKAHTVDETSYWAK